MTAALTAAAANWLILRRIVRRRAARPGPAEDQQAPTEDPPPAPGDRTAAEPGILVGVVDEREDLGGHRIFLKPSRPTTGRAGRGVRAD